MSVSARKTSLVGATPPTTLKESQTGSGMGLSLQGEYFFNDLITTVIHRKLSEAGRGQYVYIAQQLLVTLWARLVNLGLGYDIARVRNHMKTMCMGVL